MKGEAFGTYLHGPEATRSAVIRDRPLVLVTKLMAVEPVETREVDRVEELEETLANLRAGNDPKPAPEPDPSTGTEAAAADGSTDG